MAKFKKGDRVRAVDGNAFIRAGWEGVVDEEDDNPWVIWDNGEVYSINQNKLQLITKTNNMNKVKIAVSFDNDSEKMAYLRYCESIGKVWRFGSEPTKWIPDGSIVCSFDPYAGDSEKVISQWGGAECIFYAEKDGYTVVPFKAFAALKGIDYKEEVSVKLNDQYTATILDGKVKVGCQVFEFERIEELYKAIQEAKK